MDFELKVNTPHLRRELDKYGKDSNVVMWDVIRDQMRLWMVDLIKKTPPKTLAVGRKSIAKDLAKIFAVTKKPAVLKAFDKRFGSTLEAEGVGFETSSDLEKLREYHQSKRNRRGSVKRQHGAAVKIGNLTFAPKLHVKQSAFRKYLKQVQSRIGILKSGWVPGALLFKGKVPSFVMRQMKRFGSAIDQSKRPNGGYMQAVNSVRYGQDRIGGIMKIAQQFRERDIDKHLKNRITQLADKFNAKRAA